MLMPHLLEYRKILNTTILLEAKQQARTHHVQQQPHKDPLHSLEFTHLCATALMENHLYAVSPTKLIHTADETRPIIIENNPQNS